MKPETKVKWTMRISKFLWQRLKIRAAPSLASVCEYCGYKNRDFFPIVVFRVVQTETEYTYYRRTVRLCKKCGAPLVTITFHMALDVTDEFNQIKVKP